MDLRWPYGGGAQEEAEAHQPYADDQHIGHPIRGSHGWLTMVQVDLVAAALAESLGKSPPWAVGFLFGNLELSMELWTVISGYSGFDDLWPIDSPD